MRFLVFLFTFSILVVKPVLTMIDCDDVLSDSTSFTGLCNNKWKKIKPHIRPTQPQVGYAWVARKIEDGFTSASNAQNTINEGPIPVILGPGSTLYIVDHHHTLCALDYSGYDSTSVTFNILCDMRTVSEEDFWNELENQNLAYLVGHPQTHGQALPVKVSYKDLPTYFSFTEKDTVLRDDPWRSLAGYSRKVKEAASPSPSCTGNDDKHCERCMYRGCVDGHQKSGGGVAYFEFRWAYFMQDATYHTTSLWPSDAQRATFLKHFEALPTSKVKNVDTSAWLKVANHVVSLCRSDGAGAYTLSTDLYPGTSKLPGFISGYVKLADDPVCAAPTCSTSLMEAEISVKQ
eukprot:gene9206-10166_t